MATVGQLAPTPKWVPEQAARIAELHDLQEQHFPQASDEIEPITGPITGPVEVERAHDDDSPEVTAEHTAEELLGDQAALLAPATAAPQPSAAAPFELPAAQHLDPADETPLLGFKVPVPAAEPEPTTIEEEPAAEEPAAEEPAAAVEPVVAAVAPAPAPAPAPVAAEPAAPSPLVTAKIPRPVVGEGEDEEPEPTRPGVRPPAGPKLLRRKRGEKVAFSGGKKPGAEATLLKLGLGLLAVLALLVFVFMQVLSSGDEPKKGKRSSGAQSESRKSTRAAKAKADEE
jgi:hypothetical protein